MSGTSYHRTSWKHRQPTRSRTGWIDTGTIWAFKADSYIAHHPQVTSKQVASNMRDQTGRDKRADTRGRLRKIEQYFLRPKMDCGCCSNTDCKQLSHGSQHFGFFV